jgi:hypothetical protein
LRSTKTIGGRLIVAADVLSLARVGVTNSTPTGGKIAPA